MTKEQYKHSIEKLNNQIEAVKDTYIISNSVFKKGDKVRITGTKGDVRFAYVHGVSVSYMGDIVYKFLKEKKDGTISSVTDHAWDKETIELYSPTND